MAEIPPLDLHPVPNDGTLPSIVSRAHFGPDVLHFHFYHNKYYKGNMLWYGKQGWHFDCDVLEPEDRKIIIRRLQAHIFQHDPDLYQRVGLPVDLEEAVLEDETYVPFRKD